MIGRSEHVTGPYTDRNGEKLTAGGGSLLLEGNKDWLGIGHNGICSYRGKDYIVFHGYDASDNGKSKLLIREITWNEDDWPQINF